MDVGKWKREPCEGVSRARTLRRSSRREGHGKGSTGRQGQGLARSGSDRRRARAGVYVRVRAASRASIKALTQDDPFIIVSAKEYCDEERSGTGGDMQAKADQVCALHAEIVELTTRMDKAPVLGGGDDVEVGWGHEKTDTSHCFRSDLRQQVRRHQTALAEGKFLEGKSAQELAQPFLWRVQSAELEELQLLSFVALAGLEPEVRLWALDQ
jgi:hypothetical protein